MSKAAADNIPQTLNHPRETYDLLGHEDAEAEIASALAFDRVHHAWLITGPNGVGKATLAYRAARILLGAKRVPGGQPLAASQDDPVVRSIAAGTHPDLFVLQRGVDSKSGKRKTEIVVDDARELSAFFGLSAGNGGRRIAIIDAADDLNRNAANALLKTIEEPPPRCVLFLVCNSPGTLPRTILSRCRRLNVRAPSEDDVMTWLQGKGFDGNDAMLAVKLARSAPGLALTLAAGAGPARYKTFSNAMLALGTPRGILAAQSLIDAAAAKPDNDERSALELLAGFAKDWLWRAVRLQSGLHTSEMYPTENENMKRAVEQWNPVNLAKAYTAIAELQEAGDALNLDRAHSAAELFAILGKIAPQSKASRA